MAKLDRDNAFFDYVAPTKTVDASDAAEKARTAAMSKANAASRPATMLEQAETLLASSKARLADLEAQQSANNVAQGLNPDGSKKTATQILQDKQTATKAERAALEAKDPLFNKAAGAPTAPEGYEYKWIGGTNTGQYTLYKLPASTQSTNGNGNSGNGNSDNGNGAVIKYDANGKPIVTDINPISTDTRDAFATLQNLFTSYGLGSLASEIAGYMTSGLTASEALIKLKTNPSGAYAERFAGNFARTKKGLNVISEAAYIDLESSYAETLKAYGLGNMLSTDSKQNAKQFASYIENDISAVEFKDRINTVQERVVNADPAIKAMFKEFYPSLTNSDLVSYFLNPTETIGKLKEKVTSAEIGAAFTGQGLTTSLTSASDLARYGIDRAGALEGAANIAGVLPEATKLGNIYGETGIIYNQQTGEQEFLKSSDEAKRKRNLLASKERASFDASAGNAPGAYSTGYLKKSSVAGLI